MHQESSQTKAKQVRLKQGGGVREQNMSLASSKTDVLETAKSLFFPGGQSDLGDAENMQFVLTSFNCEEIGDTVKLPSGLEVPFTVQNYALSGGFSRVKLYLKSMKKDISTIPPEPCKTDYTGVVVKVQHPSEGLVEHRFPEDLKMSAVYDWIKEMESSPSNFTLRNTENKIIPQKQSITAAQKETIYIKESDPVVNIDESDNEVSMQDYSLLDIDLVESGPPMKLLEDDLSSSSSSEESLFHSICKSACSQQLDQDSFQPGKRFRRMVNAYEEATSTSTNTLSPSETEELLDSAKIIDINRKNVLQDMLKLYEDTCMINCQLNVRFVGEARLDFGGLTTDLFTSFWDAAFESYFEGDAVKGPFVPLYQQLENRPVFEKLGRILYHGWVLTNQIPVRFSEASFVSLIHGEDVVDEAMLERSFLLYLTQFERDVLTQGLSTSNLAPFQEDAIYGIYQQNSMNCLPATSPEELRKHVVIMARTHFVYKPMNILMWMRNGIGEKITILQSRLNKKEIKKLYEILLPSKEKVLAKITYSEDLKPEESRVLSYLRNYIGTLDDNLLDKFIRFVTGSPSAPQKPIQIAFNSTAGLRRFPSSSTCSSVLHLSTSYLSFAEFKKEFNTVLTEDISFEMGVL